MAGKWKRLEQKTIKSAASVDLLTPRLRLVSEWKSKS
jgi:hypothetical protein